LSSLCWRTAWQPWPSGGLLLLYRLFLPRSVETASGEFDKIEAEPGRRLTVQPPAQFDRKSAFFKFCDNGVAVRPEFRSHRLYKNRPLRKSVSDHHQDFQRVVFEGNAAIQVTGFSFAAFRLRAAHAQCRRAGALAFFFAEHCATGFWHLGHISPHRGIDNRVVK
jgi:hypothetical protein